MDMTKAVLKLGIANMCDNFSHFMGKGWLQRFVWEMNNFKDEPLIFQDATLWHTKKIVRYFKPIRELVFELALRLYIDFSEGEKR